MGESSPKWATPAPLGYGAASEAAHFVAAPLLAGACVATVGVLGADTDKFRWPAPAMLLLTLAFVAFIGSVQYGFHARQHLYSPSDIDDWHPPGASRPEEDGLRREQRRDFQEWRRLSHRGGLAYNAGIVFLGIGTTLVLAPPGGASLGHALCRWTASAVAALGSLAELEWILRRQRMRRALVRAARRDVTGGSPHV
ncbi:hypothetical protein [Streptomyces sp. NPDC006446]|uniref:hypothetical protein n=1 Tax=Streptomyces sp. NPDC006446 TaxID=3154301 RepID=UPI0033B6C43D